MRHLLIGLVVDSPDVLLNGQINEIYVVNDHEYVLYRIDAVAKEETTLKLTVSGLSASSNYLGKFRTEIMIDTADLKKGRSIGNVVCFKSKGLLTHLYLPDPNANIEL